MPKRKAKKAKSAKKGKPTKVGRPTDYCSEYADQARKLCLLGARDADLASFFEVSESTINTWKIVHPEFLESIKAGKDDADANVAHSLYHRALGYSHPDVHISNYQGAITKTNVTKHYPPDTVAAIFWLKNRQSDKWRDKKDVDLGGTLNVHKAQDLSDDELAAIAANGSAGTADPPASEE